MTQKNCYTYEYPRPAVTTDCVVFGFDGKKLNVLLIKRGIEPYMGSWAFPGGFLRMDETVEECARRELLEETNVSEVYLEQFHTFSAVDRDPRCRVVTIAFYALVKTEDYMVIGGDDASQAKWFPINDLPELAFDHKLIFDMSKERLQERLRTKPIAFKLLNDRFTMTELQNLYEVVLETKYDRRNFARKALNTMFLVEDDAAYAATEEDCMTSTMCFEDCREDKSATRRRKWYRFNKKKFDEDGQANLPSSDMHFDM